MAWCVVMVMFLLGMQMTPLQHAHFGGVDAGGRQDDGADVHAVDHSCADTVLVRLPCHNQATRTSVSPVTNISV